jgi:hypothetical protein
MGLRFRRSLRIAPGVRLNLGSRGASVTIGKRGASINVGRRGTYLNAGIPGTGLSYREKLSDAVPPAENRRPLNAIVVAIVLIAILGYALSH